MLLNLSKTNCERKIQGNQLCQSGHRQTKCPKNAFDISNAMFHKRFITFQFLNVIVRPAHGFEFDMPAVEC
jgi:hypothetical protein